MENKFFMELEYMDKMMYGHNSIDRLYDLYRILKVRDKNDFIDRMNVEGPDFIYYIAQESREIPVFQGDADFLVKKARIISEFTVEDCFDYFERINRLDDRESVNIIPESLSELMLSKINSNMNVVFIPEAEKFGFQLYKKMLSLPTIRFKLSYSTDFFKLLFEEIIKLNNVYFESYDIYKENFTDEKFDAVISFPIMGGRNIFECGDFISKEPCLIAVQNLLYHLKPEGKLVMILPAKITFGGGSVEVLRHYIEENYKINEISSLPNRVFYPKMAINTFLFVFSTGSTDEVIVKRYTSNIPIKIGNEGFKLIAEDENLLFRDEFEEFNNWVIDMAFKDKDVDIESYNNSSIKKNYLGILANVYRGKAVSEKTTNGNIAVINIKDIKNNIIDYSDLDTFDEEERKVASYILREGDVLISSRGTTIKVAVFHEQNKICIASSNLSVIRSKDKKMLNNEYLRLFLLSRVGLKLLKSLQRGTTIVNINTKDIEMIEVPIPSIAEQDALVSEYNTGLSLYEKTVKAAEDAWNNIQEDIFNKLY